MWYSDVMSVTVAKISISQTAIKQEFLAVVEIKNWSYWVEMYVSLFEKYLINKYEFEVKHSKFHWTVMSIAGISKLFRPRAAPDIKQQVGGREQNRGPKMK